MQRALKEFKGTLNNNRADHKVLYAEINDLKISMTKYASFHGAKWGGTIAETQYGLMNYPNRRAVLPP